MLLLFSEASNMSVQMQREVERAVHKDVPLIPLRIENVMPTRTMEYFISSQHWFDAIQPPIEQHLDRLAQAVQAHLARKAHRRRCWHPRRRPAPLHRLPAVAAPPVAAACGAGRRSTPPNEPLIVGNYELTQVLGHRPLRQHRLRRQHRLLGNLVAVRVFRPTEKDNKDAIRARFLERRAHCRWCIRTSFTSATSASRAT